MTPFSPVGDTVNIAVTAASQALLLTSLGATSGTVRLVNIGNQTIFLKFGTSGTTTTTAAGFPLMPNTAEIFAFGSNAITHVAVIAATTGSTLYATSGQGV